MNILPTPSPRLPRGIVPPPMKPLDVKLPPQCHDEQHYGPYLMSVPSGKVMHWQCPSGGKQSYVPGVTWLN